jgi:hypothetical protein
MARDDARQIVAADPNVERPEHAPLREATLRRFGTIMELAGAG